MTVPFSDYSAEMWIDRIKMDMEAAKRALTDMDFRVAADILRSIQSSALAAERVALGMWSAKMLSWSFRTEPLSEKAEFHAKIFNDFANEARSAGMAVVLARSEYGYTGPAVVLTMKPEPMKDSEGYVRGFEPFKMRTNCYEYKDGYILVCDEWQKGGWVGGRNVQIPDERGGLRWVREKPEPKKW